MTNHSGGADGADTYWETVGETYNVETVAYSFIGHSTSSPNQHILTQEELDEGWTHVLQANVTLNRHIDNGTSDYVQNLVSRNWFQVKNSTVIYAVGTFADKKRVHVSGGTGWAVQMAKDNNKPIFLFNQSNNAWFTYSYQYKKFLQYFDDLVLVNNFAGIGTRSLNEYGKTAIEDIYKNTFE